MNSFWVVWKFYLCLRRHLLTRGWDATTRHSKHNWLFQTLQALKNATFYGKSNLKEYRWLRRISVIIFLQCKYFLEPTFVSLFIAAKILWWTHIARNAIAFGEQLHWTCQKVRYLLVHFFLVQKRSLKMGW